MKCRSALFLLSVISLAATLLISCEQKQSAPLITGKMLTDIKTQCGITLSTNTKVLYAGDQDSRSPGYFEWVVFVKFPEKIPIPPGEGMTNDITNGGVNTTSVEIAERVMGRRIKDPVLTIYKVWDTPPWQCNGSWIVTKEGEYLCLERFAEPLTAPTNTSPGAPH